MRSLLIVALGAGVAYASVPDADSSISKRAWISKTALLLGVGYSTSEVEVHASRSREEILEELMSRDDFADAVLGFNLYFLGLRPPRIIDSTEEGVKHYNEAVYHYPSATRSAMSFLDGKGDYLSLFDFKQPWYIGPLLPARTGSYDPVPPDQQDGIRKRHSDRVRALINELISEA